MSINPDVYVYSGAMIRRSAKLLMLSIVLFLLLTPIAICMVTPGMAARILVIIVFTITYLFVLSWLNNPKMTDIVLAGATYGRRFHSRKTLIDHFWQICNNSNRFCQLTEKAALELKAKIEEHLVRTYI